ncbi:NAD(P)(+) transhydrogenase (Re/Si-specific) subunit beta, partial [Aerococcus urinae]|nr:NAD(P)(+) transhydrogenase (Re/Si-specific) subunit beta [Aerococcus urinae]
FTVFTNLVTPFPQDLMSAEIPGAELLSGGFVSHFVVFAYIVAAIFFILALAGLSRHETAQRGNNSGIIGMAIALVATIVLALTSQPARGVVVTAILIALAMS